MGIRDRRVPYSCNESEVWRLTMFYMDCIKRLNESIKNNNEIPKEEKQEAAELLQRLANLLWRY